jgi:hypothetical protein
VALVFASHLRRFIADPSWVDQPQSTQFRCPLS